MAFKCQLGLPPFHHDEIDEGDRRRGVALFIGNDLIARLAYFVYCYLSRPNEDEPEFAFAILQRSLDSDETVPIYDRQLTKNWFSPEERELILFGIVQGTAQLLRLCRPKRVFRCTAAYDPPPRAMWKHNLVTHVFVQLNYDVTEEPPYLGNRMWTCVLRD